MFKGSCYDRFRKLFTEQATGKYKDQVKSGLMIDNLWDSKNVKWSHNSQSLVSYVTKQLSRIPNYADFPADLQLYFKGMTIPCNTYDYYVQTI